MTPPAWLASAWSDFGQREQPGSATNPRIAACFRDAGHPEIRDDETAWCAAFVGAHLERTGHRSTRSLMARSYLKWGEAAKAPVVGAVAVLSRGSDPSLGHVGFLLAQTSDTIILLGGNQSNAVTVEAFELSRLVALRWPAAGAGIAASSLPAAPLDLVAFEAAFRLVLALEGGWSDDPFDPGGATNKGITIAVYARELGREITADSLTDLKSGLRAIPEALVRRIYLERYWRPARCPDLPAPLALFHFDTAVNMGVGTAARMLQQVLGVDVDGDIGPRTRAAAEACDVPAALDRYADLRRRRYRSLGHFWRFGRGWLSRVDTTLAAARRLHITASSSALNRNGKELTSMPTDLDMPHTPAASHPASPQTAPASPSEAKWWGESMTIWGALLTAVTTVAPLLFAAFGIEMPASLLRQLGADTITAFQAIAGFVGTVMTIAGRIRASSPLETRRLTVRF